MRSADEIDPVFLKRQRHSLLVLHWIGFITTIIGALTLLAWLQEYQIITQIHPRFYPTQLNTILCFIALGMGTLFLEHNPKLSLFFSSLGLLISGLTLVEYFFKINLGIDTFFGEPFIKTKTFYPGRTPSNVAFYLMLVSSLLINYDLYKPKSKFYLNLTISIFIAATGLMAILGLLFELPTIYEWKGSAHLSLISAILLFLMGGGLSYFFWITSELKTYKEAIVLPIFIMVGGSLIFLIIWQSMVELNHAQSWFPFITLLTGISFTFMLAVMVRLFQRMKVSAQELRHSELKFRRQSRTMQLMLELTNSIANTEKFEIAIQHCLTLICISFQWPVGHLYLIEKGKLIPSDIWYLKNPKKVATFRKATTNTSGLYGVGLCGRVWASGLAMWIYDVTKDNNFPRKAAAQTCHLHSAFAFPIKIKGETTAILEFFSHKRRQQDDKMLQLMNTLSAQISRYIEYQMVQEHNQTLINRFRFAVGAGKIGVWEYDLTTNQLIWDEQMFQLYGVDPSLFHGRYEDWVNTLHPEDRERAINDLQNFIEQKKPYNTEFRIVKPDGEICFIHTNGTILFSKKGAPIAVLGVNRDVTKEKNLAQNLQELNRNLEQFAYFDALTGLMNRYAFEDAAMRVFSQARRKHQELAILFIDLDYFKNINDTLGHQAGDEVLMEVANRLRQSLRREDLICRLGGDEFAVILSDITKPNTEKIANKIIHTLDSFSVNTHETHVGTSIGIAFYPESGKVLSELLDKADQALIQAKREGRAHYQLYKQIERLP